MNSITVTEGQTRCDEERINWIIIVTEGPCECFAKGMLQTFNDDMPKRLGTEEVKLDSYVEDYDW